MTVERADTTTLIRDLPPDEKPRERLRTLGGENLSNPELIAILLRTGMKGENVLTMATRLIAAFDGLAGLAGTSFADLCRMKGISEAKACQLLAAFELGRRVASLLPGDRPVIRTPADVHNLLGAEMAVAAQERLRVVLLTAKAEVVSVRDVYQGTVDSAQVRIAEVLRPAVRENCPAVIAVHNHPSGDPTPSPEDIVITRRMLQSAEMMDIDFNDHVIIGSRGYVSLKERMGF